MLLPALLLSLVWFGSARPIAQGSNTTVLILGGGVSGVIAARTLHRRGIRDFVIIEGRHELGGRMQSHELQGGWTIEAGANWIQGTAGSNPIHELAMKHRIRSQPNDFDKSFSTYDSNGEVDYHDIVVRAADEYTRLTDVGVRRFNEDLVDLNSRAGYALIGAKPMSKYEAVAEYFQFDLEFAQTPEQTSWVAQSMNDNFTYETTFADDADLLAIDPRGFKALIQSEANEFLQPSQAMLNTRVVAIDYSDNGVSVRLDNGQILNSQYALCTFSLGVLQSDDITFSPVLPWYKQEALQSMAMGTYTKIFFKFKDKFWFDTEMGLYADTERGRYPVWQSLDHPSFLPGSGIIFVTVTGSQALRVEGLPDEQVKAEALQVLRSMFPEHPPQEPEDFFFHRWHFDPLFRGSYSNWPASFFPEHHMNVRANLGRLYFGGEATSLKYFGFLHGAYYEGHDMAEIIAQCVETRGEECRQLERVRHVGSTVVDDRASHTIQSIIQADIRRTTS